MAMPRARADAARGARALTLTVIAASLPACLGWPDAATRFPREPAPPASYVPVAPTSAVRVRLVGPEETTTRAWLDVDGRRACFAPCTVWASPTSRFQLHAESTPKVAPVDLSHVPPGALVRLRARADGTFTPGLLATAFGGGFVLVGAAGYATGRGAREYGENHVDLRPTVLVLGAALLAVGIPLLLADDLHVHASPDPL